MFSQDGFRLAAALRKALERGVESGEHILVAGMGIGHRGDVGHHQPVDPGRGLLGDLHGYLAPHGVTDEGHLLKPELIQQGDHIRPLLWIAHLAAVKGGTVVAQIDADDPVLLAEGAGQQAQVVQAAEQAVDQHDDRALSLILEIQ